MSSHTKEPWGFGVYSRYASSGVGKYAILGPGRNTYGYAPLGIIRGDKRVTGGNGEANARRIVACVNFCEGIETEALEMAVKEKT